MTVVAWRIVMMARMATVASVLALLQRMIEYPTGTDLVAIITGTRISARRMSRRTVCQMAVQTGPARDTRVIIRSRQPCGGGMTLVASHGRLRSGVAGRFRGSRRAVVAGRAAPRRHTAMVVSGG